jgi:hypothetical protein
MGESAFARRLRRAGKICEGRVVKHLAFSFARRLSREKVELTPSSWYNPVKLKAASLISVRSRRLVHETQGDIRKK